MLGGGLPRIRTEIIELWCDAAETEHHVMHKNKRMNTVVHPVESTTPSL